MKTVGFSTADGGLVCCGASVYYDFGKSHTIVCDNYSDQEIKDWLEKSEGHSAKALGNAFSLAVLNDAQVAKFGDIFKERGWVFSEPMWHPKHSTRLYLIYKPLQKDPGLDAVPSYKKGMGDEYGKNHMVGHPDQYKGRSYEPI